MKRCFFDPHLFDQTLDPLDHKFVCDPENKGLVVRYPFIDLGALFAHCIFRGTIDGNFRDGTFVPAGTLGTF